MRDGLEWVERGWSSNLDDLRALLPGWKPGPSPRYAYQWRIVHKRLKGRWWRTVQVLQKDRGEPEWKWYEIADDACLTQTTEYHIGRKAKEVGYL